MTTEQYIERIYAFNYQKIIAALTATHCLMQEVDKIDFGKK